MHQVEKSFVDVVHPEIFYISLGTFGHQHADCILWSSKPNHEALSPIQMSSKYLDADEVAGFVARSGDLLLYMHHLPSTYLNAIKSTVLMLMVMVDLLS